MSVFSARCSKLIGLAICVVVLGAVPALAQELIVNGGFETGTFAGWNVTNQANGTGDFFVVSGTGAGGGFCCATVGPKTGSYYAGSFQPGPGTHVLTQSFTIPASATWSQVRLSFDMFVNNYDSSVVNPAGLDFTAGQNEHGRVDLLTAGATPFDTGAGVIRNFYIGDDGLTGNPHAYIHYSFPIGQYLAPGGTYQIRFAEVDNTSFFNMGVDNVSIQVVPSDFQVGYAANLNVGESYVNIVNTGANGAPLLGPGFGGAVGNICVNVYAFSPDEQLISCCSCLMTPNAVASLGVNRDLTSRTLTGVIPTSVTVKLLPTLAGTDGSGTSCNNSAATVTKATLVNGMAAWGTTLHQNTATTAYDLTERRFTPATLSAGELASIAGRCASILGNGSGFGICYSCRTGALGGDKM